MLASRSCFYVSAALACAVLCYVLVAELLLEDGEEVGSSAASLPPTLVFPGLPSGAFAFASWLAAAVTFSLPATLPSSALAAQCASLPHCAAIAGTQCGWCWDGDEALPGGHRGDVRAACADWTWFASQCALHVDCALVASCAGIVGTHCGWCRASGRATKGGPAGPKQAGDCDAADWVFEYAQCEVQHGPQHLHLMYGDQASVMVVTWATASNSTGSVHYSAAEFDGAPRHALAATRLFAANNPDGLQFIHRANMSGLIPGARYRYHVANGNLSSATFLFTAAPPSSAAVRSSAPGPSPPVPFYIVYGDMGRFGGAPTLKFVEAEVEAAVQSSRPVTAVLHLGDFAYDLRDNGGVNGDAFMARIERLAASTPYMTTPGNHEMEGSSFSHYRGRFTTPGMWDSDGWRMHYSLDLDNVHFLAYNTEIIFTGQPEQTAQQLQWLEADLIAANAARSERSWIVAFGHRPFYCSNNDGDDCSTDQSAVRATFERLFDQYGVDLVLEAHEHSYERLYPAVDARATQYDYVNPLAPTHIVTGTAGCNEQAGACINAIPGPRGDWSAFHSANRLMYGYGHLQAVNATHLWWDEVLVEEGGKRLDGIWLVQERHGNFSLARERVGWQAGQLAGASRPEV